MQLCRQRGSILRVTAQQRERVAASDQAGAMLPAPRIVMFIVFLLKVVCYYNIRGVIGNAAWAESQMSSLHGSRREKHAHLCGEVPT